MPKYSVWRDIPVFVTVEADDRDEAIEQVNEDFWDNAEDAIAEAIDNVEGDEDARAGHFWAHTRVDQL